MSAMLLATLLCAAAPDDGEVVWGPLAYFGAAAGLSATTSVLLALPEALVAIVSLTTATFFAVAAAPIVTGFGLHRMDTERAFAPILGASIGDGVGAVLGGVLGALLLGPRLSAAVPTLIAEDQRDYVGYGAGAVAGAWLVRALGAGTGAAIGRGISLSLDSPAPSPST